MNTLQEIAGKIKSANSVLILAHMSPDGDALGSALALAEGLKFLKTPYQVCVETDIPSNLTWIDGVETFGKKPEKAYDLMVCVDCADDRRLGALQDEFFLAKRNKIATVNIDHHVSNTRYAAYNYVRSCAANCINVAALLDELSVPITKKIAEYLLIGLLTDSGNFSHDDVTEETFILTAKLIAAGADVHAYHERLFKRQTKARAILHAKVMGATRYYHNDRFAVIVITQQQLEECGADIGMTEGFVDFPLSVDTVEVAASLLEIRKGQYQVSLRTKTYADANKIAGVYGGGGHVRASGCRLFGDVEEVIDKLSYTVSQYLED